MKEEVLEKRQRILGKNHPDTILAMNNLAHSLRLLGRLKDAAKMQEVVLITQQRILDEDHPDTIIAMKNLAMTRRGRGQLQDVAKMQEVLEKQQQILGDDHPNTILAMSNLAITLLRPDVSRPRGRTSGTSRKELRFRAKRKSRDLLSRLARLGTTEQIAVITLISNLGATEQAEQFAVISLISNLGVPEHTNQDISYVVYRKTMNPSGSLYSTSSTIVQSYLRPISADR